MAIIKSYTDIEQSKKLAEILSLESADMQWFLEEDYGIVQIKEGLQDWGGDCTIPCWSLAALLNVLPKKYYPVKDHKTDLIIGKPKDEWCVLYWDTTGMQNGEQTLANNPIDACYEMILKLHELKML